MIAKPAPARESLATAIERAANRPKSTAPSTSNRKSGRISASSVAATELALILPLFLLLVLGAVDFGRFAARSMAVANDSRAGAGFAIMNPYTTTTQAVWTTLMKQAVVDEM